MLNFALSLCLLHALPTGVLTDDFTVESMSSEKVELYTVSPRRRSSSGYMSPRRRSSSGGFQGGSRRRGGGASTVTHSTHVGDAFKEFLLGLLLVVLAFPFLYYNEKRQVHMAKIFDYAEPRIKNVSADSVDADNEARVVCVQGTSRTDETLQDPQLSVKVQNCSKLDRKVEMWQWKQHETSESKDTGNGNTETITKYTYDQGWHCGGINSGAFKQPGHDNPPFPSLDAQKEWTAKVVSLGAFKLDEGLIAQMCKWSAANIESQKIDGKMLNGTSAGVIQSGSGNPAVGDLRVTMKKVECGACSVASIQSGESFQALTYALVPDGSCCSGPPDKVDLMIAQLNPNGGDVEVQGLCTCVGALIESGECMHNLEEETKNGKQILEQMRKNQESIHTGLQILGFLMFLIGDYFIFKFGGSVFSFIPWVGNWIESLWKSLAFLAAIFCACQCWLVTVALSWLAMRPMKGIVLLVAAGGLFAGMNVAMTAMSGSDSVNDGGA